MTAREYFEEVRKAERELWRIRQQQEHAMEMATRLTGHSEVNIRSMNKRSPVESAGVRLADLSADLRDGVDKYVAMIQEARQLIEQIPQERFREVLVLRYLCGHSWKTIQDEMEYSGEKSVYKVHGYALAAAENVMKNQPTKAWKCQKDT